MIPPFKNLQRIGLAMEETHRIYQIGRTDLEQNKKLGHADFGLSFILPFAAAVVRHQRYTDKLDWLDFDELSAEELKAMSMLVRPLVKTNQRRVHLYEGHPDYHACLYPIWTANRQFTGQEPVSPRARVSMLQRRPSKARDPIPRKYLRSEPKGWNVRLGLYNKNSSPMACAVTLVRRVVANGLDEHGEPNPPPGGYSN